MIVQNIRVNKTDFSKQKQRFKPASTNAFEYNEVLNKYENTIKKLYANIINFDPGLVQAHLRKWLLMTSKVYHIVKNHSKSF